MTLLDQNESFSFGFSKLDVLFGRKATADVLLKYRDISKESRFPPGTRDRHRPRRSDGDDRRGHTTPTSSPSRWGPTTTWTPPQDSRRAGSSTTPVAGAERMRDVLPTSIRHDPHRDPRSPPSSARPLRSRARSCCTITSLSGGIGAAAEIRVLGPMTTPVPITKELS